MSTDKPFSAVQLFQDLNQGKFQSQLDAVISEVGAETATWGRAGTDGNGEIVIKIKFTRVDDTRQLKTDVDLSFKQPKHSKGWLKGGFKFGTRLFVMLNGSLTFLNEGDQKDAFKEQPKSLA